jgi:hypothetical protein
MVIFSSVILVSLQMCNIEHSYTSVPLPEIIVPTFWQDIPARTLFQATRGILSSFVPRYIHSFRQAMFYLAFRTTHTLSFIYV